jgi:type I restriction enzyme S subunit
VSELPSGWVAIRLGEIANFEMGQAPPGAASNFEGRGKVFVKAGEFGPRRPVVREWTTDPKKFATADDVLICVVGATAGKLNLGIDCAIGRSVAAIRPTPAIQQLLLYFQLLTRVDELRAGSTGSAQVSSSRCSRI